MSMIIKLVKWAYEVQESINAVILTSESLKLNMKALHSDIVVFDTNYAKIQKHSKILECPRHHYYRGKQVRLQPVLPIVC